MTIRVNTDLQAIYIHEPLGHTVPAMTAAWTVAGLYRMEADVNLDTLLAARYGDTAGTRYLGLFLDADGATVRIRGNNGTLTQSAAYTLAPGEDYRLALDYDGAGTARMLIDGAVVLSHTFTPTAGTNGERSFQIGGYGEISGYTSCTVARWRMWSAVLTEVEHRAEYRSLVPVRTSGLLHDWPMVAGTTRLNDTVGAEPDLAQNESLPVGDGAAFVYRPSIIGTPQVFDLGQTTTPGARTITVPTYAEGVAVFFALSDSADTPDAVVASMGSTFAGTFSINNSAPTSVSVGGSVCLADVTSTGAGKTFTPTFSATSIVGGVVAIVAFLQDIPATWLTDFGFAHATGGGTTAGTASADGLVDGLAIALDAHLSTSSADYPANESGWTPKVTGQSGPGAYAYYTGARLRQKLITATGTESATTQSTVLASVVALLTIPPGTLAVPAELAGAAGGVSAGTGAITTGIRVAGAALMVAVAPGGMTTGIRLGGASSAAAAGTGALNTGIRLAGAPSATAASGGALSTAIPLSGVSAAVAAASASMASGAAAFAGNAAAAASGAGQLSTLITFSSAALAQALSSALLTTGITMTVAAIVQAAADGTLTTAIALLGGAAAQASAPGSLTAGSGLSGAGSAAASASAALTIQIRFAANAFMAAAAAAGLNTAILLAGQGTGQAGGSGTLSGGALFAGAAGAAALANADLTTAIPLTASALAQAIAAGGLTVEVGMGGLAAAFATGTANLMTQIQMGSAAAVEASATGSLDIGVPVVADPRYEIRTRRLFTVATRRTFEVYA